MIYPTRRAVLLAASGALVALLTAALAADYWYLALAWPLAISVLIAVDAVRSKGGAGLELAIPSSAFVGEEREAEIGLTAGPDLRQAEIAFDRSPLIAMPDEGRVALDTARDGGTATVPMTMLRRGLARLETLWLRWPGPLGLVWRQREIARDDRIHILPDLRPTRRNGVRLFERYAIEGSIKQLIRGEGGDFDALVEFRTGMDRRSIDWKSSARATKLLARHYHGEKNNQICFAIDCGRQMSEPVAGMARVDHMIGAILLTGWLALRVGDRISLTAFDSRPRLTSGFFAGASAFSELQRLAAGVDYGTDETNFTFALTELNARLHRRSLVILFTEVTDRISARFLLSMLRLLIRTHLVLVVMLRNEELESLAAATPEHADDVARAITAGAILKERQEVVTELRRLGVDVLEAGHDEVAPRIAEAYLDIKRRDRL
ncbi:DUF58 domain-containing protein [Sphingomonas sp. LHG3443-2]|uniref:DUF58 domain-containing protein n=1 Tax=Sphingomonas sp. LHG3443-2 TaxID=2804639 RepID=UPI003CFAB931